jgi:type IV pilus assembly protein PilB
MSLASPTKISERLDEVYRPENVIDTILQGMAGDYDIESIGETVDEMEDELGATRARDRPVIQLVDRIVAEGIQSRASDIHLEPEEAGVAVRYRIDGVLRQVMILPKAAGIPLVSRVKIMAQLDIAERRLPQDGRIKMKLGKGREMDFRVSVLPTLWGEKIVMRLLDKGNLQLDMMKLGFDKKPLEDFLWAVHQPWGMVLVTGPTGSGKTTTLYSALSDLNKVQHNISTAEDPVEYNLHGINQVQMHEDIGLNFAASLRAFLRQDPDIIMVGEIRDFETAEIAVKAALTGHMVLSTLHTNDAPATIFRLLNMGVEPFLITASVNLVLAQRLARKVCVDCKTSHPIERQALVDIGFTPEQIDKAQLVKGAGCRTCNNTGYKGRVALYEVMRFTDNLKEMVLQGAPTAELKMGAIKGGMMSLRMSGIQKILDGVTTTEEILRVTMSD